MTRSLKNYLKLDILGMQRAVENGTSFDQFLKPMEIPDMTLFTDAALNIGSAGCSEQGHWFKNNWNDIRLLHENNRDSIWNQLVAMFAFLHSLRHSLNKKVVPIFTDNEERRHVIINMPAKLSRPDLQLIIKEKCRICI